MKFLEYLDNLIVEGVGSHRNLPNLKITVHNENILDVLDQFFVMRKIVEYMNSLLDEERIVKNYNDNIKNITNDPRIDKRSKKSLIEKEKKEYMRLVNLFYKTMSELSFKKKNIFMKPIGRKIGSIIINADFNGSSESEDIKNFKTYTAMILNSILNSENINMNNIKIDFIKKINSDFKNIKPKILGTYFQGKEKVKKFNFLKGIDVNIYHRGSLIININDDNQVFSLMDSITHDLIFHVLSDYNLFQKFGFNKNNKILTPITKYSVKNWIKEFHAVYYSHIFDDTDIFKWNFPVLSNDQKRKTLQKMNLKEKEFLNLKIEDKIKTLKEISSQLNLKLEPNLSDTAIINKFFKIKDDLLFDINFYTNKLLPYQNFIESHMKQMLKYVGSIQPKPIQDYYVTWEMLIEQLKDYPKLYKLIKNNSNKFPPKEIILSDKTKEYLSDFYRILSKGISSLTTFFDTKEDYFINFEPKIDYILERIKQLVDNVNRTNNYQKYIKDNI